MSPPHRRGALVRAAVAAAAAFVIFGPLSSLLIWAFAEKWFWPHPLPSQWGLLYWRKAFEGRLVQSLATGVWVAFAVTAATLLLTVPLGYTLARRKAAYKPFLLLAFLLPQAFPQLPVFINTMELMYRWNLAGTSAGVILIHMTGALVYAVWTMTAAFKSIPRHLEEAAVNLGSSPLGVFLTVSLPLAAPGIVASALLVFLYSLDEFIGTLLVGAPFVLTLPVFMYNAAQGYEMQVASVTALLLMLPGVAMLVVLERYLKAEYLAGFGRL